MFCDMFDVFYVLYSTRDKKKKTKKKWTYIHKKKKKSSAQIHKDTLLGEWGRPNHVGFL
jgi:hypothetical protein